MKFTVEATSTKLLKPNQKVQLSTLGKDIAIYGKKQPIIIIDPKIEFSMKEKKRNTEVNLSGEIVEDGIKKQASILLSV